MSTKSRLGQDFSSFICVIESLRHHLSGHLRHITASFSPTRLSLCWTASVRIVTHRPPSIRSSHIGPKSVSRLQSCTVIILSAVFFTMGYCKACTSRFKGDTARAMSSHLAKCPAPPQFQKVANPPQKWQSALPSRQRQPVQVVQTNTEVFHVLH